MTVYRRLEVFWAGCEIVLELLEPGREMSLQWVSAEVVVQTRMLRKFMGARLSPGQPFSMTYFSELGGRFCFVLGLGGSDRAETWGSQRCTLELLFARFSA